MILKYRQINCRLTLMLEPAVGLVVKHVSFSVTVIYL